MRFFKPAVIFLIAISITSCSLFKSKPVVIKLTELRSISVPETLLEPIVPPAPPSPTEFEQLEEREKIKTLAEYITTLLGDIEIANTRFESIRLWNKQTKELIDELNKKNAK